MLGVSMHIFILCLGNNLKYHFQKDKKEKLTVHGPEDLSSDL